MALTRLEHYLVLSDDIERTRDFYCALPGLVLGARPELGFPGYWIYLGDIPVIHIAEWKSYSEHSAALGIPVSTPAQGTGTLDHIAFNGQDADVMLERLESLGISYCLSEVPNVRLRQIFINDPNGIKIEMNFFESPG